MVNVDLSVQERAVNNSAQSITKDTWLSGGMALAAALCALPSVFLLLAVPPLFNYEDSLVQFLKQLPILVPHWPPVYPLFVRSFQALTGWSAATLYEVLIAQHIIAVCCILSVVTIFQGIVRRLAAVVLLLAANYFGVLSHGIYSESLTLSFMILYLGLAARYLLGQQNPGKNSKFKMSFGWENGNRFEPEISQEKILLLGCYVTVFLLAITRYGIILIGGLMPLFCLLNLKLGRKNKLGWWRALTQIVLLVSVAMVAQFTCTFIGRELGSKTDLPLGRSVVYRMHALPWDTMTVAGKAELISRIKNHASEPVVKAAIEVMIEDDAPWTGSIPKIEKLISEYHSDLTVDQIMNKAAFAFFATPNVYLVKDVMKDVDIYWSNKEKSLGNLIFRSVDAAKWLRISPLSPPEVSTMPFVQNINPKTYNRISKYFNAPLFDWACNYYVLSAIAFAAALWRARSGAAPRELPIFIVAALFCAFVYSVVPSAVEIFLPRYQAPLNTMVWTSLTIALLTTRRKWQEC